MAPAKVNLHLAIGQRRPDGYHDAATIMHALTLHDVVYMRLKQSKGTFDMLPTARMVPCGDVAVPDVSSEDNIACKAVVRLAEKLGRADAGIELRIEKNIPFQGGLGGGSSNAAAALVGAAWLWGVEPDHPVIEDVARSLGSDVAFFLRGGCAYHEGTGDVFVRSLVPSKQAIALVKPAGGVSTAEAYRTFDNDSVDVPEDIAQSARDAHDAADVVLFNNLAPASEHIMPQLVSVRTWLLQQEGVQSALLCGSGATTFAPCLDFAAACRVVADARKQGWWARATSFGSTKAMVVASEAAS
jgi:4-diphosphocytidyl-2-C-methyl-D-erythritol kinase